MDDPAAVGGVECIGNLNADAEQRFDIDGPPANAVLQRLPIEILHGDEGMAVMFIDLVYGADVRVIQGGCRLSLPLKAAQGLRIACDFVGKELQSDEALELGVLGFEDNTHAAAAEFLDNPVVRYGLADHAVCDIAQQSYEASSLRASFARVPTIVRFGLARRRIR